jgi:hypothetical protein
MDDDFQPLGFKLRDNSRHILFRNATISVADDAHHPRRGVVYRSSTFAYFAFGHRSDRHQHFTRYRVPDHAKQYRNTVLADKLVDGRD